jgi:DNA-binding beta-propeller fold protein YncE
MGSDRISLHGLLVIAGVLCGPPAQAIDLIVSASDGKFVRVEGVPTFPQPAPPDSLAVIDAEQSTPVVKFVVEGLDHTVQGPPQAVAITPDGKLVIVGAPSHYDYNAKKETLGTFPQVVDLEASPPRILGKVDIGVHTNGLAINPEGSLLIAAALDGTVRVLSISGKELKVINEIKVGDKRLSGISFTHDGRDALVSLREQGGLAVLSIDGSTVRLTDERVSTGLAPYAIDVSSDGKWAIVGNAGLAGLAGYTGRLAGDADVVTLVDVSKHPFRAIQHLSVPSVPEGVAISPSGKWIVVQANDGSNLRVDNPGRRKLGKVVLFAIGENGATKVNELPAGEASQGIVFGKDNETVLVQFNVEKSLAIFKIRGGELVDTGERLKLAAGPVSIRSMPR